MEDFLSSHLEATLAMFASFLGSVIGVAATLKLHGWRIGNLEKTMEKHIENSDIHFHRRETDLTGQWPKYEGTP